MTHSCRTRHFLRQRALRAFAPPTSPWSGRAVSERQGQALQDQGEARFAELQVCVAPCASEAQSLRSQSVQVAQPEVPALSTSGRVAAAYELDFKLVFASKSCERGGIVLQVRSRRLGSACERPASAWNLAQRLHVSTSVSAPAPCCLSLGARWKMMWSSVKTHCKSLLFAPTSSTRSVAQCVAHRSRQPRAPRHSCSTDAHQVLLSRFHTVRLEHASRWTSCGGAGEAKVHHHQRGHHVSTAPARTRRRRNGPCRRVF